MEIHFQFQAIFDALCDEVSRWLLLPLEQLAKGGTDQFYCTPSGC
jgi:hypothetical protein